MELEAEAKKLVDYIDSLGLSIPTRKPPHEHIGTIIADAVLQVGHRWKTHVGPRVECIRDKYPEADTISGLSYLVKTRGAEELLNWHGKDEQERFRQTVNFLENEQVKTFDDLRKWLESEDNRDRILTKGLRDDKAGIAKIADKTADYYRVLVGIPDAVKVDSRVERFLTDAGIEVRKYDYKKLRTIVQLAAKQLGKRPIDLDSAIWNYQGTRSDKGGEMAVAWQGFGPRQAEKFSVGKDYTNEVNIIKEMKRPENWTAEWFKNAKRGNYLLMWQYKQEESYPEGKNPPGSWKARQIRKFNEYIKTPHGIDWQNTHKPSWLPQKAPATPPPTTTAAATPSGEPAITISLPPERKEQLDKLAGEWEIDASILARIWILERLRQLR